LVFHVVCVLLFCGILSRKEPFTKVALHPLSKRMLIFLTCLGFVGFLRV
jgi:hypothetical protein